MDKPKNRNTITIKINGKPSPFQENKIEEPAENQEKVQNQKEDQSQLPEQTELESAAAREHSEDDSDQFEWILPETTKVQEIEEFHPAPKYNSKKSKFSKFSPAKKGFSYKKPTKINITMVLAVFFAVLLGTFFGLLLLKVVPANQTAEANPPIVEEGKNTTTSPPVNGTLDLTLEPLAFSVVQEGVYSTQESAEQSIAKVKAKGVPVEVFSSNGQFALFIGVSENLETAKLIGSKLKSSGMDTYSKEFSIEGKTVKNLLEEEKKLLELSTPFIKTLLTGATAASSNNNIPNDILEQFKSQSSNFNKIDKTKLKNKEVIQLHSQLEAAIAQYKMYEKNPDSSTLNMIQQHLLSILANYQKLK